MLTTTSMCSESQEYIDPNCHDIANPNRKAHVKSALAEYSASIAINIDVKEHRIKEILSINFGGIQ